MPSSPSAPAVPSKPEQRSPLSRRGFLGVAVASTVTASAVAAASPAWAAPSDGSSAADVESAQNASTRGGLTWLVFDHHVHSVYSHDAKYTMTTILDQAQRFGVDAIAFTEHSNKGHANIGGVFNAAHEIEVARTARPDLLVFQGLEWYIPAAEHGTVIVAPGAEATRVLRRFELDHDGKLNGWDKPRPGTSDATDFLAKATEGIAWLGAQKRAGAIDDVVVLANHPSRLGIDSPSEMRAWHDADRDVFVGMEGAPGAQASALAANSTTRSQRGEYENNPSQYSFAGYPAEAYRAHGGFDWQTAVVGGVWDSFLSEGRRWWITSNSDLHLKNFDTTRVGDFPTGPGWESGATLNNFNRAGRRPDPVPTSTPQGGSDLWPGEFSRTHVGVTERTHLAVLDAVRRGRMWVDHGHLVESLSVQLRVASSGSSGVDASTLGGTLVVAPGTPLELVVDVSPTTSRNSAGILPRLAHLDVIRGTVTGPVSDQDALTAPNTRVVEMLDVSDRSATAFQVIIPLSAPTESGYVRLRGSDGRRHGVGPLGSAVDPRAPLPHDAGAGDPWQDTWLYTNPIFFEVR